LADLTCPVCRSIKTAPAWTLAGISYRRCGDCRCLFATEQFADTYWEKYYSDGYHEARGHGGAAAGIEQAKKFTIGRFFHLLTPMTPGARLLEVGCGTGDALSVADELGYRVVGIDLSEQAIAKARERYPRLLFHSGMVEKAALPDGSFDVIVLLDVIEHIAHPQPFADAIVRLLNPGGRLLIITPDAASLSARLLGARWFHAFPEHVLLHSRRSLKLLFEARGLFSANCGFAWKWLNLEMLARHTAQHSHIWGARFLHAVITMLPTAIRSYVFPFNIGEFYAVFSKPRS